MHHHNVAFALPTEHAARHRRRLRALALGLGAIAALAPAAANAQVDAIHRHHSPAATHQSITFTNPLGRSRGPGAGGGLL
jgi:hypothetical protein